MQTNDQVLSKFGDDMRLHGLALGTQRQYLWIARAFLKWSNRNAEEMNEDDIQHYIIYLTDTQKLNASTINTRCLVIRLLLNTVIKGESFSAEPRRILVKNGCLKDARGAFIQYLHDMGYEKKNLKNYKWIIKCVDHFMHERGHTRYTRAIGEDFLRDAAKSGRHTPCILETMGYVLRRFDCFMEQGEFSVLMPRISKASPPQFAEGFADYLNYMRTHGMRESTIEMHRYNIQKALLKFDAAGIRSFSEIEPKAIYDAFQKTSNKRGFCSPLRCLLRYLYKAGTIGFDYSEFVPSVRKARPVPSVYTAAETKQLLDTTETNLNSAKRNNAVILLALRLGLRSGDIANLKLTDVDFISKTVSFVQEKTFVPQRLELLPDIEDALLSYISTARPASKIPNVFLTLKSPIRPITANSVYSLVSSRFEKSDIDTDERARGGHALRMTLASELVAENVPYDAVRKILGHEDPVSAKHYVKFDIEALRSCAIEVPAITGKLAAYIHARLGGCSL